MQLVQFKRILWLLCCMITNRPINIDKDGNAKAIRACYGKCGFDSIFIPTGHGITGIMRVYETE